MVVTANRLGDGAVVYRTVDDDWTTDLASAAVVAAPAAAELLQRAEADGVRAVGPYIAPVELAPDNRVLPGNLRERIRLAGPDLRAAGVAAASEDRNDVPLRRFRPDAGRPSASPNSATRCAAGSPAS